MENEEAKENKKKRTYYNCNGADICECGSCANEEIEVSDSQTDEECSEAEKSIKSAAGNEVNLNVPALI